MNPLYPKFVPGRPTTREEARAIERLIADSRRLGNASVAPPLMMQDSASGRTFAIDVEPQLPSGGTGGGRDEPEEDRIVRRAAVLHSDTFVRRQFVYPKKSVVQIRRINVGALVLFVAYLDGSFGSFPVNLTVNSVGSTDQATVNWRLPYIVDEPGGFFDPGVPDRVSVKIPANYTIKIGFGVFWQPGSSSQLVAGQQVLVEVTATLYDGGGTPVGGSGAFVSDGVSDDSTFANPVYPTQNDAALAEVTDGVPTTDQYIKTVCKMTCKRNNLSSPISANIFPQLILVSNQLING